MKLEPSEERTRLEHLLTSEDILPQVLESQLASLGITYHRPVDDRYNTGDCGNYVCRMLGIPATPMSIAAIRAQEKMDVPSRRCVAVYRGDEVAHLALQFALVIDNMARGVLVRKHEVTFPYEMPPSSCGNQVDFYPAPPHLPQLIREQAMSNSDY